MIDVEEAGIKMVKRWLGNNGFEYEADYRYQINVPVSSITYYEIYFGGSRCTCFLCNTDIGAYDRFVVHFADPDFFARLEGILRHDGYNCGDNRSRHVREDQGIG